MLKYSRDKNEGTCRSGEGEEEPATSLHICDPGSELLLGGRREGESDARILNWMEKKNGNNVSMLVLRLVGSPQRALL